MGETGGYESLAESQLPIFSDHPRLIHHTERPHDFTVELNDYNDSKSMNELKI